MPKEKPLIVADKEVKDGPFSLMRNGFFIAVAGPPALAGALISGIGLWGVAIAGSSFADSIGPIFEFVRDNPQDALTLAGGGYLALGLTMAFLSFLVNNVLRGKSEMERYNEEYGLTN